jgi:hypothetical protein
MDLQSCAFILEPSVIANIYDNKLTVIFSYTTGLCWTWVKPFVGLATNVFGQKDFGSAKLIEIPSDHFDQLIFFPFFNVFIFVIILMQKSAVMI